MRRPARTGYYVGLMLLAPVATMLAAGIILSASEALIRFILRYGR